MIFLIIGRLFWAGLERPLWLLWVRVVNRGNGDAGRSMDLEVEVFLLLQFPTQIQSDEGK
jgi:hypothetical protein